MLRARSGEGQTPKPPAVDETALAEMGQVIAEARAEIDRLVQLGELQDDPIRYPIQALSVHLDALFKVTLACSQTLANQIEAASLRIETTRQPVREGELRRAVTAGISGHAGDVVRMLNRRTALMGAGMLLVTLLAGAGAGYWYRGAVPVLVGLRAGSEKCEDRPDGSRLCWIPVWEKLPPTKGN
jgi:hypothetical protein